MNAIEVFQDWLNDYLNFEHNPKKDIFWLDTIDFLCQRFDYPQDSAPSIHVAGSKGKGSVSRMIACILEEAGYNIGVFTSPHISDFRERICKPNSFFEEEVYINAIKELVPKIESIMDLPADRPITWFELVTLFAFLVFRKAKTDWNVIEVGMGGRLDSTNVIRPKLSCITSIELEHTEFLGDSLQKIAGEKAGIIKNCTPVIVAKQQNEDVRIVFREKAITRHAPVYFVEDIIKNPQYSFDKKTKKMNIHFECDYFDKAIHTQIQLLGKPQFENACMAALAVKKLFPNLDEEIINRGLAKASLPGRFEILEKYKPYENIPYIILDGAHTENSIRHTLETLNELYPDSKVNLLFACAADKDIEDISILFKDKFQKIYLTKPGSVKHSNLKHTTQAFSNNGIEFESSPDYKNIIKKALEDSNMEGNILLITGSFYLIAEVNKILNK